MTSVTHAGLRICHSTYHVVDCTHNVGEQDAMQLTPQHDCEFTVWKPRTRGLRRTVLLVVLIIAAGSMAQQRAQAADPLTLVTAGGLLDPRTGNLLAPAAVLIDGNKIKQVGAPSQIKPPSGARVIDLGEATLLPGLIDSHTHLLIDPVYPAEVERARRYNGGFAPDLLLAIA
jgi:hypothetical protein